ncbi:MAG: hypothetical protein GY941_25310, partial [Planctomycetes bacterium]|nr:hypothetical protein [Planctomycetota bacterium]
EREGGEKQSGGEGRSRRGGRGVAGRKEGEQQEGRKGSSRKGGREATGREERGRMNMN